VEKEKEISEVIVGAEINPRQYNQIFTYENYEYTFRGELKTYNYDLILKDKQTHIYKLYELANFYVDADSIFGGIIKRVLVPFSLSGGYKLKGTSDRTKQKYLDFYDSISFLDVAKSIFFELYLFGNCYIYFMPDGRIITLPPHKVRISDIMVNGEPVIEFNLVELNKRRNTYAVENFIDTLIAKYQGYPPEITEQLEKGMMGAWVQLNPANTFVLQESKPMWQRYAIPFISTCLKPLAKKELISYYEDVQLNIGAKGFLHAKLGHDELLPKPNQAQLNATAKIFQDALNKFPLAVTSHFVDAKFINVENQHLFDKSKYTEVNSQILSSGGISPLIVTGESDGSSFAQANISVETASQRLIQNQNNFAEMMKKFNKRLALMWRVGENKVPTFCFNAVNLTNDPSFKDEAFKLWQSGCISYKTLLNDFYDLDYDQEYERKTVENDKKDNEVFAPPINPFTTSNSNNSNDSSGSTNDGGRPKTTSKESKQDKNNSQNNPKPSTK